MTPHNTVLEDIAQTARTGGQGIGLWEAKFEDDQDQAILDALAENDVRATLCLPRDWTILYSPLAGPDAERDPEIRTQSICESLPRLAKFDPVAIVVAPGGSGDPAHPAGPLDVVADSLARVADVADELGLRIAFELLAQRRGSPLPTLPGIVDFIDQVGRDNVGVLFDIYHSYSEPDLHDHVREHVHRIEGVHVNDIRDPERSWCDRVLPGDGLGVAPEILATLIEAGYDGWYELEVFSDDGTFGNAYPDSLWDIPHEELLSRGRRAFDDVYARAVEIAEQRSGATARTNAGAPSGGVRLRRS